MAWGSLNTLGSNRDKTSGNSIAITTSAAAEAGNVVVVIVAIDNTATADGNTNEITSITDSAGGNTWTKAREFCNARTGAATGATVAVFYSKLTNQINSGGTITANLANSIVAKAISAWEFSITAGATLSVSGTPQDLANVGADPGSMTIESLTSQEYLFVRGIAAETSNTGALTPTASYTAFTGNQTSSILVANSMAVRGEFRIFSGTGNTSDPTYVAADCASVYFALKESTATQYTQDLTSGMSTFGGAVARGGQKPLVASMSTFAGAQSREARKPLAASMSSFAAALVLLTAHALTAAMSTFDAILTGSKLVLQALNASMSTFAATLSKRADRLLAAAMETFAGVLAKLTKKTLR